jgi:predicted HicB family RNase H-like nuclease
MARPKIYDEPRVTTAFRLTSKMREELRRAARDQGVSVNRLVVTTLSEYLAKRQPLAGVSREAGSP